MGQTLLVEVAQTVAGPATVPFFRLPLEIDYVPGVGQPAVTVRSEHTQDTMLYQIPLPAGTTVSSVRVDPRLWNLLLVTRTRRDMGLVLAAPTKWPPRLSRPTPTPAPPSCWYPPTRAPAPPRCST